MIAGSDASNAMRACILECPGVQAETKTSSATSSSATGMQTASSSKTGGAKAAASTSSGAAVANLVPASLAVAGGVVAFFL
jgi:hypothetical protein